MKVVHVQWEDPGFSQHGWLQCGEFAEWAKSGIPRSDSVGLLAYESDNYIVLVQSVGETQVADGLKINRASIKSIQELGETDITLTLEGD